MVAAAAGINFTWGVFFHGQETCYVLGDGCYSAVAAATVYGRVLGNRQTNKQTDGQCHRVYSPTLRHELNPLIAILKPQSNGPSYSDTVIGTLAIDGWAVKFCTARWGLGGASAHPGPSSLYRMYCTGKL